MQTIGQENNTYETNKFNIIWGNEIATDGFTMIPNVLIRNYRKLGIQHGEFGFLAALLSFKHDERDPYPSRETLAEILNCGERQISKWIESLKEKGFIKTDRVRRENQKWDGNTYDFRPLIKKLVSLAKPCDHEGQKPHDHEGPKPCEPEVQKPHDHEGPSNIQDLKKQDLKEKDIKDKEIKRDQDHDSINSLVFEKYKDQITEQEFTEIVNRIKEQKTILNYESYLTKSVQSAIQEKTTKKRTFNMFYKRNEKKDEQPKEQKQPEQPKPSRKSGTSKKSKIPVVDYSNEEAPVVTEEELEEMIRFAEEMAAFKPEGVFYRQQA